MTLKNSAPDPHEIDHLVGWASSRIGNQTVMDFERGSEPKPYKTHGHIYSPCVPSTMLRASETCPLTKTNLQRLQGDDRAMIRQICNIKPEDMAMVRSRELLAKLEDLDLILRERRLCWFWHVDHSSGAFRTASDIQIEGKGGGGGGPS